MARPGVRKFGVWAIFEGLFVENGRRGGGFGWALAQIGVPIIRIMYIMLSPGRQETAEFYLLRFPFFLLFQLFTTHSSQAILPFPRHTPSGLGRIGPKNPPKSILVKNPAPRRKNHRSRFHAKNRRSRPRGAKVIADPKKTTKVEIQGKSVSILRKPPKSPRSPKITDSGTDGRPAPRIRKAG